MINLYTKKKNIIKNKCYYHNNIQLTKPYLFGVYNNILNNYSLSTQSTQIKNELNTINDNNEMTNNNETKSLSINDLNEMIVDPTKYNPELLKPYFRRISREGYVMHGSVITWYLFAGFAILLWTSFVTVWGIDNYLTKKKYNNFDKITNTTTNNNNNNHNNNDNNSINDDIKKDVQVHEPTNAEPIGNGIIHHKEPDLSINDDVKVDIPSNGIQQESITHTNAANNDDNDATKHSTSNDNIPIESTNNDANKNDVDSDDDVYN
mmetsp:Transcript_14343/g.17617  ORF Transcript_14343/g.17617 Transcript_14343/m.17617 type:complete len:264 (-) Transcript_14343:126-917(-)